MTDQTFSTIARGAIPTMRLQLNNDSLADLLPNDGIDTLIVPVFAGATGLELAGGPAKVLTSQQEIELWKLLVSMGAQGKAKETTTVPGSIIGPISIAVDPLLDSPEEADTITITVDRIVAVGLGDVEELTDEDVRIAAGIASRAVQAPHVDDAAPASSTSDLDDLTADLDSPAADEERTPSRRARVVSTLGVLGGEAAYVGHALGAYNYRGAKSSVAEERDEAGRPAHPVIDTLTVLTKEARGAAAVSDEGASEDEQAHAAAIVDAVTLARDLVNAPGNHLYPASYAALITALAEARGLEVEVLDEQALDEQGFGGIVGVGKGSARAPRLVRILYRPEDAASDAAPTVALVGKGITFDTGGISLKPGANMDAMISDMGGSAAMVASMLAIAELKLPIAVTATIPLAENMPGSRATRPGDILRHYGGTTTEVLNTDAEGRLVLADAIVRACEDQPQYLIEAATLTGAQMVALGERTPGIMGSIAFRDRVSVISQRVGDHGWPMPLPVELGEALKSDVADLRNISNSRWGGMSVAGQYLAHFVPDDVEWVHMDIAGPAYNSGAAHGYTPKRGTGAIVRTVIGTIEDLAGR